MKSNSTFIGLTMDETPIIHKMLRISAPIIFPTAISPSPLRAAVIQILISGRDVPIAITVAPMMISETEKCKAIPLAAQTIT